MKKTPRLILDLGTNSAKAYLSDSEIIEVDVITWSLLESHDSEKIEPALTKLLKNHNPNGTNAIAIGTAAMRRNAELELQTQAICQKLGIKYQTLSQQEEANLIKQAVAIETANSKLDIINVGGGSIQIIAAATDKLALLQFGISDLNRKFNLTDSPSQRKIKECIHWLKEQLPSWIREFVYTGGEKTYLESIGVPLYDHRCHEEDFKLMSQKLEKMQMHEIEQLSPFDTKWMQGAIASNCIVISCLEISGAKQFTPNNLNIAHGLISQMSKKDGI